MDGGAWWAAVHGVTKSQTRLSDLTFTFHFHALEKEHKRMDYQEGSLPPSISTPRRESGSLVPGILQARTLEWVAISFSNALK